MSSGVHEFEAGQRLAASRWAIGNTTFAVLAFLVECVVIIGVSVASGAAWHVLFYDGAGAIENYAAVGGLAALVYTLPFAFRDEYDIEDFLEGRRATMRMLLIWTYAFLALAVIGFLTKTTGLFSRGWLLLFYFAGLVTVISVEAAITIALKQAIARGRVERRRVMLIGSAEEIERTLGDIGSASSARVVATGLLADASADNSDGGIDALLTELVARARTQRIDDIVVLLDWAHAAKIERIVTHLRVLPIAVHVGASSIIGRFANPRIARFGSATALSLSAPPLGPVQMATKRVFDGLLALIALLLLSPVFVVIATLVKMDSAGPVFFRQHRRGYNHQEFRIWKFRTMTTLDDGPNVKQAERNDVRVTPVGRWLRRLNLDELPQLVNVLMGEMSLVGPRPHAVAHDMHYETRIEEYPRRLNVKPGITGWAQVHGFRGATETEDDMRRRVEHDIYYIENWSLVLDIYILALTVLSPSAYRNAF